VEIIVDKINIYVEQIFTGINCSYKKDRFVVDVILGAAF